MTTNWIFVFLLVILVVLSWFAPLILGIGTFGIGSELPSSPSVWDILTFNAAWMWAAMTFSIPGMPAGITLIFWVGSALFVYCVFRLIRGVT